MDIGAHLGLFTVLMARRVGVSGRVFSFEPADFSRSVLSETVRLNGCADVVEIRSEAVAQASGKLTFYETGDILSNANSLVRTARTKTSVTVDAISIDDFARAQELGVRCMKIDVEGAEQPCAGHEKRS